MHIDPERGIIEQVTECPAGWYSVAPARIGWFCVRAVFPGLRCTGPGTGDSCDRCAPPTPFRSNGACVAMCPNGTAVIPRTRMPRVVEPPCRVRSGSGAPARPRPIATLPRPSLAVASDGWWCLGGTACVGECPAGYTAIDTACAVPPAVQRHVHRCHASDCTWLPHLPSRRRASASPGAQRGLSGWRDSSRVPRRVQRQKVPRSDDDDCNGRPRLADIRDGSCHQSCPSDTHRSPRRFLQPCDAQCPAAARGQVAVQRLCRRYARHRLLRRGVPALSVADAAGSCRPCSPQCSRVPVRRHKKDRRPCMLRLRIGRRELHGCVTVARRPCSTDTTADRAPPCAADGAAGVLGPARCQLLYTAGYENETCGLPPQRLWPSRRR